MNDQGRAGALQAIREEAQKLLDYELRQEIEEGLGVIVTLTHVDQEDQEGQAEALRDILGETEKLLAYDAPNRVEDGIKLIYALARYEHDVRTKDEESRDRGHAPQG